MTSVLLDTRLLVWSLDETDRLPTIVRSMTESRSTDVLFSSVSIWEIAIKARLGRTNFGARPDEIALAAIAAGFTELPVRWQAAAVVADLPQHHRDPFDRMLVAQAMTEPAHLYTVDRQLVSYSPLVRLV